MRLKLWLFLGLSACGVSGGGPSRPAPIGGYLVYVHDREGSVLATIDDQGHEVSSTVDDSFGLRLTSTGTLVPREFLGQQLDPETGYYHFKHRYYDPATAQWVSPDPKLREDPDCSGLVQGCNPYAFAGNRPLEWTDPDGRWIYFIHDPDGTAHVWLTVGFAGPDGIAAQRLFIASLAQPLSNIRVTAISRVFQYTSEIPKDWNAIYADRNGLDPDGRPRSDEAYSLITLRGDGLNADVRHGGYVMKHELWHAFGHEEEGYTEPVKGNSVTKPGFEHDVRGNFWHAGDQVNLQTIDPATHKEYLFEYDRRLNDGLSPPSPSEPISLNPVLDTITNGHF